MSSIRPLRYLVVTWHEKKNMEISMRGASGDTGVWDVE